MPTNSVEVDFDSVWEPSSRQSQKKTCLPRRFKNQLCSPKMKPRQVASVHAKEGHLIARQGTYIPGDWNARYKLDMVVVASCAVLRPLRQGNGYVDLDNGVLTRMGGINRATVFVTGTFSRHRFKLPSPVKMHANDSILLNSQVPRCGFR